MELYRTAAWGDDVDDKPCACVAVTAAAVVKFLIDDDNFFYLPFSRNLNLSHSTDTNYSTTQE